LWPETVSALREALARRPEPKSDDDAHLFFITKYGRRWVRLPSRLKSGGDRPFGGIVDSVRLEFGKLQKSLRLDYPKSGFYTLRHVFRTICDEVLDRPAIDRVMGHLPPDRDMSSHYVHRIADERLVKISEFVRDWLFQTPSEGKSDV
jgi:integrase